MFYHRCKEITKNYIYIYIYIYNFKFFFFKKKKNTTKLNNEKKKKSRFERINYLLRPADRYDDRECDSLCYQPRPFLSFDYNVTLTSIVISILLIVIHLSKNYINNLDNDLIVSHRMASDSRKKNVGTNWISTSVLPELLPFNFFSPPLLLQLILFLL